ncbi:hypothetical protein U1Q18_022025 [Sarracenia purpurea var. burkii]
MSPKLDGLAGVCNNHGSQVVGCKLLGCFVADKGCRSHTTAIALVCSAISGKCSSLGSILAIAMVGGCLQPWVDLQSAALVWEVKVWLICSKQPWVDLQWSSFGARSGFVAKSTFPLDSCKLAVTAAFGCSSWYGLAVAFGFWHGLVEAVV